jgi:hypothetical protein
MKRFISILAFSIALLSLDAGIQKSEFIYAGKIQNNFANVSKDKDGVYSFSHALTMNEEKKAVWIKRISNDRTIIKTLEILDNKVLITFNEGIGEKEIEEAITYCASKFGYQSIKMN